MLSIHGCAKCLTHVYALSGQIRFLISVSTTIPSMNIFYHDTHRSFKRVYPYIFHIMIMMVGKSWTSFPWQLVLNFWCKRVLNDSTSVSLILLESEFEHCGTCLTVFFFKGMHFFRQKYAFNRIAFNLEMSEHVCIWHILLEFGEVQSVIQQM